METKYRKQRWDEHVTFSEETWDGYDLTETDFTNVVFQKTAFKKCVFSKSKFAQVRLFDCSFFECQFDRVDLSAPPFGAASGLYQKCCFKKCDFHGQNFAAPRFEGCLFDHCKLKRINFNDTTFSECKFVGVLVDVTFNGIYRNQKSRFKPLEKVDFSEASFGEFVSFQNSCDLTTCIPPKGTAFDKLLYNIYSNDPTVLSTGSADRIVLTRKPGK